MNGAILSGDRHLTSNALLQRVRRAASGFSSLGVGEGDAIALLLRNDFAFFEAALAADMIGAYSVPINWHFKSAEAGYIISDSGAKVLVAHTDLLPAIQSAIPPGVRVFRVETPAEIREAYGSADSPVQTNDALDWDEWVNAHPEWSEPARPARNAIIYTSGTTGKPKGVRRAPATADMAARMGKLVKSALGLALDQPIRTVITGPIYHAAPNLYALWAVRGGGLVILQPKFDAEQLLAMIDQHRITHLHMVPTMFVRLLALPEDVRARYNVSSLQFVAHAAAPCPPEIKRQMIAWWGPVIHEYYGGTETGGVVACNSADALRKPGTVGRALDGCAIRILDEKGATLAPNHIGEVYIRNESFPEFTYHGRDDLRAAIERGGFVSLGDIGYLDEDGFLFLCDRARDIVISGGVNIYPAEIEAELVTMPGVADCAVFGIPDPQFGEKLCAFVEVQNGASLNAAMVQDFLRARLADYKVPRHVEFHTQLPREDSGKIFKRQLRAPFWEAAGRQI